jgi:hypothetical protein
MRVRPLSAVSCNTHKVWRNIDTRYKAVEPVAFVLHRNRHRQSHAVRAISRCHVNVHSVGSNVTSDLEGKRLVRVNTVSLRSSGNVGLDGFVIAVINCTLAVKSRHHHFAKLTEG